MHEAEGESGKGRENTDESISPPNYIPVLESLVPTWIGFPLSYRERINKQKCFSRRRKVIAKLCTFHWSTIKQVNLHQVNNIFQWLKKKTTWEVVQSFPLKKVFYSSLICVNTPCDCHQLGTLEDLMPSTSGHFSLFSSYFMNSNRPICKKHSTDRACFHCHLLFPQLLL